MSSVIINYVLPYTQTIATGSQSVFSTNWTADSADDVLVYQRGATDSPDDATDILPSSAYTVAFIGADELVEVTLITAATLGDVVTITRLTPVDRENLYTNTNFTPSMLNQDFGLFTLMIQENDASEQVRTPRYPNSAIINTWDLILPILGPGQSWAMNAAGDQIEAVTGSGGGGDVTLAELASHNPGEGASLIGLEGTGTVQDLAEAPFIVKTANAATPNAQVLASLTTGILKNTTTTGVLSISSALTSIDNLITAADDMIYTTAANTYAVTALTPVARTLLAQTTFSGMAGVLGALSTTGGTMSGQIDMGNNKIINMADPSSAQDAVTLAYQSATLLNYLLKSGGTMTGAINMGSHYITNLLDPVNPQDAATRNYVDTVATGLTVQPACRVATTAALTATYANGASGIGATLTNSGALAALSIDSVALSATNRVLVWKQASALENGIYEVTNAGSGAVAWVLTRATDYDQPAEIQAGDLVVINEGSTYAGTSFIETANVAAIGTDAINFSQFTFSATAVLLKVNNLSDVNNTVTAFNNISPTTTKGDIIVDDGTNDVRLGVGANNTLLMADSAQTTGLKYTTTTYPNTVTINRLLYASSTNIISDLATANSAVLVTNQLGVPSLLGSMTNGQLVIGSTGAIPVLGTISAGAGVSVTNTAGGITIAATGTGTSGGYSRIMSLMGA